MGKKSSFFKKIRISYNAPVTLTFALTAVLIMVLNALLKGTLIPAFFTVPGGAGSSAPFNIHVPLDYLRLVLHIFGHADWNHLVSNLSFILLLGPVIEERYGSPVLALMMLVTSLVTGVLNACFSPLPMLGSSDIAFMMILLTSFTSISKNEIPLSFILILILYVGRELFARPSDQNIATLAHIAGGLCGSMFAFLAMPKAASRKNGTAQKKQDDRNKSSDEGSSLTVKNQPAPKEDDSTVVGSIEL